MAGTGVQLFNRMFEEASDSLDKLKKEYEKLLSEHCELKKQYEEEHDTRNTHSEIIKALERQNVLLREIVEEKECEVAQLEQEIHQMKGREAGTVLIAFVFSFEFDRLYVVIN